MKTDNKKTLNCRTAWQNCLLKIQGMVPREEFVKWFLPVEALDFDGSKLRLKVPNNSFYKQLDSNYLDILQPLIRAYFGEGTTLTYAIPKNSAAKSTNSESATLGKDVDVSQVKNPFILPAIRKESFESNLNPKYTFANFIEGDCNRMVRSAAFNVSLNPGSTAFNPLFIFGDSGLGKTHVAQAIGNEVKMRHPKLRVLYVPMSTFKAQFQTANINKEVTDFISFYQKIDVLIIDDIQELSGLPGTQNAFFNIFNHLQMNGKQLVLVSDKPPVELVGIEERLITRFKWGLSAQIHVPDRKTKLDIIRLKANDLDATVSEDVQEYLADNISANVREIEGAISSLVANSKFLNKRITIDLTKEILKVYVSMEVKEITIELIINTVCEYMKVDREKLESNDRTREVALARQLCMFLAKEHTKMSLVNIGHAIGNRNHATVLHSCKTIQSLMDIDKVIRKQVNDLEKLLS